MFEEPFERFPPCAVERYHDVFLAYVRKLDVGFRRRYEVERLCCSQDASCLRFVLVVLKGRISSCDIPVLFVVLVFGVGFVCLGLAGGDFCPT